MRTDPAKFMAKHFKTVPAAAKAAFNAANQARLNPPERMPVMSSLPAVAPELRERSRFGGHVVDGFRSFQDAEHAEAALYAWRAGWGRFNDAPNKRAEAYLRDYGITPCAIATTTTSTAGGYLTADPVAAAIITKSAAVGVANRLASVFPMDSPTLTVPMETGGLTVRYTDESTGLTESDFTFGDAGFTARKRTVLAKVSNELNDDALIVWLDHFVNRAAYALASVRDGEAINGDGTSTYDGEVGLLQSLGAAGVSTAATGHDTWPELTVSDFAACMALLPSDFAHGGEEWLCSPQFFSVAMLGSVGGGWQGFDLQGRPLFLGKPVNLSTKMPQTTAAATVACLYGSFPEALSIGDRGIAFAASDSAYGAFDRDVTFLKASSRYDISIHNAGDASTVGAYVGLKTAS